MKQIIVDNYVTNYYITKDGKCYNSKTGKYLKGQISNSGYLNYNLSLAPNIKKRLYAHRLVANAYLENNEKKPEVNHKDGNKLNNKIENLEWVTSQENIQHSYNTNLNQNCCKVYCFNKDLELVKVYDSIQAVTADGFTISMIQQEVHKQNKALTKNYYWNDNESNNFEIVNHINAGTANRIRQLDLQGNCVCVYNSMGEAARAVNGTHSHISECCRGKIRTYKGYKWEKI